MKSITLICVVITCLLLFSRPAIPQTYIQEKKPALAPMDSLIRSSHEKYFENLYDRLKKGEAPSGISGHNNARTTSTFPNVDISQDTFPQNEPSVRISHKNPNKVVAAWRDFRTGVTPAVRRVGYGISHDGGRTWGTSALLPIPDSIIGFTRNSDPAVCVDTSGNFYVATVALNNQDGDAKLLVYKSYDQFPENMWLASFAPTDTLDSFYDKEYIECDLNPTSPFVDNLYIVWSGTKLTRSTDEGITWSHSVEVSQGGSYAPDLAIGKDGSVNVASIGNEAVIFNRSTDGGVSFSTDKTVDTLLSAGVGGQGAFPSFPSIAADVTDGPRKGYLYVVWSDSRYGDLDVFLSFSPDGGKNWSVARRVNDDPIGDGKLQYWPWLAVDDRGVISIVYYDTRNTPDSTQFEAYLAYSWDGGLSFTNRLLSTAQSTTNMPNGAVRFGDYIGIDSWGLHTVPVWTDERAGGYDMSIYTAIIDTLPIVNISSGLVSVDRGWNLISLPVLPTDMLFSNAYPTAIAGAYSYAGTYQLVDTLEMGKGYWARFDSNQSFRIIGDTLRTDSIPVTDGWNLIGSLTQSIQTYSITSNPAGMVTSQFFGYTNGYTVTDSIVPGTGYWVKVDGVGTLVLSRGSAQEISSRIKIRTTSELPPLPPEVIAKQSLLPASFALAQCFPNPFNPATTIKYELPTNSYVSLRIYNLLGQLLETLFNGIEPAGYKQVSWNASSAIPTNIA